MSPQATDSFDLAPAPDPAVGTLREAEPSPPPANQTLKMLIDTLPVPVWVTATDGQLVLLNERARALVARGFLLAHEKPCQRIVQSSIARSPVVQSSVVRSPVAHSSQGNSSIGNNSIGNNSIGNSSIGNNPDPESRLSSDIGQHGLCAGCCCLMEQGRRDGDSCSGDLQIVISGGQTRWYRVFVSTCQENASQPPLLLHLAFDIDKARRIESYFERVVARSGQNALHHRSLTVLTRREKEVLDLLAADETLWGIADRLCLSYSTVRNHVRNILAKFGVHSIIEAVALYLTAS